MFNIPEENHFFDMPWDQELSNEMVSAWTHFAVDGVPKIATDKVNFEWTTYSGKNKENEDVMVFRDTLGMKADFAKKYRSNVCDFWLNEVGYDVMDNICNAKRQL